MENQLKNSTKSSANLSIRGMREIELPGGRILTLIAGTTSIPDFGRKESPPSHIVAIGHALKSPEDKNGDLGKTIAEGRLKRNPYFVIQIYSTEVSCSIIERLMKVAEDEFRDNLHLYVPLARRTESPAMAGGEISSGTQPTQETQTATPGIDSQRDVENGGEPFKLTPVYDRKSDWRVDPGRFTGTPDDKINLTTKPKSNSKPAEPAKRPYTKRAKYWKNGGAAKAAKRARKGIKVQRRKKKVGSR